jgi:hypothetical protein
MIRIVLGKIGFGNQLFIYGASLTLAEKKNRIEVTSHISETDSVISLVNDSSILRWIKPRRISYLNLYLFCKSRFPHQRKIIEEIFNVQQSHTLNPLNLKSLKNSTKILEGYFQNLNYLALHSARIKYEISQIPRSSSFEEFAPRENERVLGIHVRRGDYLDHKSTFGVMSAEYFLNCIELIQLNDYDRVVCFSDDVDWCKRSLELLDIDDFIGPKELPSILETHYLLGMSDTLICSNSTFSISAAAVYGVPKVIVPDTIYIDTEIEEELTRTYPLNWIKTNSIFERFV